MLKVENLTKEYGDLRAVDGISFAVERGEIFGFLGPNGAGKTTTLEMIEGLRRPSSGKIFINNISVWPNPKKIQSIIGVQLQSTSFYDNLKVNEVISLFGALYNVKISTDKRDELLDIVSLQNKQKSFLSTLSGGQKQRLAIITTLVNNPEVIFLDEPTTGLDPQARRKLWDVIINLKLNGKTIVLTTHYMEEAQTLCDRIAVVDQGKIIAIDTPEKLIKKHSNNTKVSILSKKPFEKNTLERLGIKNINNKGKEQIFYCEEPSRIINKLFEVSKKDGNEIQDLNISSPTLEDVFINLTGKELRD